jgi:hypothetical protein
LTWLKTCDGRIPRHINIATLETWVMDRQKKINRGHLAVIACAMLSAGASFAAEREGKSAPKAGEAVSYQEGSPAARLPADPGIATSKTGTNTGGPSSGLAGNRNDAGNVAAPPFNPAKANGHSAKGGGGETSIETGSKGASAGGKSAGVARGIDLVRPDDGYANLRRRATRSSLMDTGNKKKLQVVPTVPVISHPPSPAGVPVEPLRNSAGVAMPGSTGIGKPDSIHTFPGAPVNTGLAKNSLGMSVSEIHRLDTHLRTAGATAPVPGINGTTMGRTGIGGVGGPAKDRSAINGSALRPRF